MKVIYVVVIRGFVVDVCRTLGEAATSLGTADKHSRIEKRFVKA